MTYEEIVRKKVPKELQYSVEFGLLLSFIKKNGIRDNKKLIEKIEAEINACRAWLAENKNSPITPLKREKTRKLACFVSMKKIAEAYL